MLTFKYFFRDTLSWALILIPISAVLSGLIWFVSNVILGKEWSFIGLWRNWYLIPLALMTAYIVFTTLYRYGAFIYYAIKIKRPFSKIEKAVLKHNLYKNLPVEQWTQEWFDKEYGIK